VQLSRTAKASVALTVLTLVPALALRTYPFSTAGVILSDKGGAMIVALFLLAVGLTPAAILAFIAFARLTADRPASGLVPGATIGLALIVYVTAGELSDNWMRGRYERSIRNAEKAEYEKLAKMTWGQSGSIRNFAVQPGGRIFIESEFTYRRLHSDGSLDASFRYSGLYRGGWARTFDATGNIYACSSSGLLYRMTPDGTLDPAFQQQTLPISDGQNAKPLLAAGNQGGVFVSSGFRHFDKSGAADPSFLPPANTIPSGCAVQAMYANRLGGVVLLYQNYEEAERFGIIVLARDGSIIGKEESDDRFLASAIDSTATRLFVMTAQRFGGDQLSLYRLQPSFQRLERHYHYVRGGEPSLRLLPLESGGLIVFDGLEARTFSPDLAPTGLHDGLCSGRFAAPNQLTAHGDGFLFLCGGNLVRIHSDWRLDESFRLPLIPQLDATSVR
jgi:hypothetical protein